MQNVKSHVKWNIIKKLLFMNEMFVPFDFLPERPIVGNEMDRYVLKRFPFNIFIAKPILKRTLLKKLPTLLLPNRIKK